MTSRRDFLCASLLVGGTLAAYPALAAYLSPDMAGVTNAPLLLLSTPGTVTAAVARGAAGFMTTAQETAREISVRSLEDIGFEKICSHLRPFHDMTAICIVEEGDAWLVDEAVRGARARLLCRGTHFAQNADGGGQVRHHFLDLPASTGIGSDLARVDSTWPERLGATLARIALRLPAPPGAMDEGKSASRLLSLAADLRLATYVIELKGEA